MKLKPPFYFLCVCCWILMGEKAQAQPTIVEKLSDYVNTIPSEKIYLHLNRPYYSPSDTIWFKAYLLDAYAHVPATYSKLVYVDLLGPGGNMLDSLVLHTEVNMGGHFALKDSLEGGLYKIRAYTRYMLNDENDIFYVPFEIYSPFASEEGHVSQIHHDDASNVDSRLPIKVEFYPEGGDLINGLNSKVAFQALDRQGLPIEIKGHIYDQDQVRLQAIEVQHEGIGTFSLKPKNGESYFARMEYEGSSYDFPIPPGRERGFVFHLNNTQEDQLYITLSGTDASAFEGAILVGHTRGEVFCTQEGLQPGQNIRIPKTSMPIGLAHFTLFDAQARPVVERLTFNDKGMELPILHIDQAQNSYKPREKIDISFVLDERSAFVSTADLSVSVTDQSSIYYAPGRSDMRSYLLLDSDLQTGIPNAAYYLFDIDTQKRFELDLVLMTQGWRRFRWETLMQDSLPLVKHYPETGFAITGRIRKKDKKHSPVQAEVMLNSLSQDFFLEKSQTDELGRFAFMNLPFKDSIALILQASQIGKKKKKEDEVKIQGKRAVDIQLDPPSRPQQLDVATYHTGINSTFVQQYVKQARMLDSLDEQYNIGKVIDLEEVEITDTRGPDLRLFNIYDLDQLDWVAPTQSAYQLLSTFKPSYNYVKGMRSDSLYQLTPSGQRIPVKILIDGMSANYYRLMTLYADFIDYMSIQAKGRFISIKTRDEGLRSLQNRVREGIISITHPAYHAAREFYAPDYGKELPIHQKPDLRNAIFWHPNLRMNAQGECRFSFYAADALTSYEIKLEGIIGDGIPISESFTVDIK